MGFWDAFKYAAGGALIWLTLSPILIPMFIVFSIWKLSVVLTAKCFQPHLIPIRFNDAFFALYSCNETTQLMSVGTTFRVRGRVETEQFMKRFQECFLTEASGDRYLNLYCYFQIYHGYIFKCPVEKLVLENHFIEKVLPRGSDPEEYLGKWIVSDTFRHKPEEPCWQVAILRRGPEMDEEETIISIKMHHGMTDGYSFVHMIDKLTGADTPYIVHSPVKECFFTKIVHVLQGPALAIEVLYRVMTTNDLVKQGNPFETNWTMSFTTMDLEIVKEIRRKTNAKFATIMMAAATGALKRMYEQDKKRVFEEDEIPNYLWLESPLAVPNHPAMANGGAICNHFAAGIFAAPYNTNNRLERLRYLEKDFQDFIDHSGIQVMTWILFGWYWLQPAPLLKKYTNHCSYLFRFAVLYSGLMTSPTKVSLLGHPVENIYFLQGTASAFPYVSLFFMCSTYAGKLDLSCYASSDLVKNRQELERFIKVHLQAELQQMKLEFSMKTDNSHILNICEEVNVSNKQIVVV